MTNKDDFKYFVKDANRYFCDTAFITTDNDGAVTVQVANGENIICSFVLTKEHAERFIKRMNEEMSKKL